MAAKLKTAPLDQGFEIQPQDDGSTKLTVRGSGLGILLLLMVFVWLLLMSVGIWSLIMPMINPGTKGWLAPIVILPIAITAGWQMFRRRSFTLTISDEGIRKGSRLYPISQISEVFVDNAREGDTVVSGVVVGSAVAVGHAIRSDERKPLVAAASRGRVLSGQPPPWTQGGSPCFGAG